MTETGLVAVKLPVIDPTNVELGDNLADNAEQSGSASFENLL
ncbi:hypothetical protein [Rathayibacter toxicus]|nr:hypothetical protein [Rathayibacter toxicus]